MYSACTCTPHQLRIFHGGIEGDVGPPVDGVEEEDTLAIDCVMFKCMYWRMAAACFELYGMNWAVMTWDLSVDKLDPCSPAAPDGRV